MPKKYTTEIFEEKVKNCKSWFLKLSEPYDSKKEKIYVCCKNGHEFEADTKSLVRSDKLKECPICKKENAINNKRYCLLCGKELKTGQISFCSISHSATYNNYKKSKNKICNKCKNCGNDLKNNKQTFCSNKCHRDFEYKTFISDWKNKDIFIESKQISNYIRKYLFEKYDSKCCKCGWNEKNIITGLSPLEVHHKDGNYKNNDESNLELLCPNCHSLTETFKSLNKGNGRSV